MPTLWAGMKQPIPTSPNFSPASGQVALFRPRRSRLLTHWWWLVHTLAALSVAFSSVGLLWQCLAVMGLAAHARWRFPPPVPGLALGEFADWAVPCLGRFELHLAPESRWGGWWSRLVLVDAEGSLAWVIFRDQLPPRSWRILKGELAGHPRIK